MPNRSKSNCWGGLTIESAPMCRGSVTSSNEFTCWDQNAAPHASFNASTVPYLSSHHTWNAASASSE